MGQMNVESFNLDHRTVVAPYVRVADTKQLPGGDVITKYDVRFCQPNQDHLPMPTLHSLEHTMAEKIRDHVDNVIDVGPMGCQTGFYFTVVNQDEIGGQSAFLDTLSAALGDVITATEVPAANEIQCGWAASHDLAGAQAAAQQFLDHRHAWEEVHLS